MRLAVAASRPSGSSRGRRPLHSLGPAGTVAVLAKLLEPGLGHLNWQVGRVGTEDIDDTVAAAVPHLDDYETVTRTPFADRVERKRAGLGPR